MSDIYDQVISQGLRIGTELMMQGLAQEENTEVADKMSQLSAHIIGKVLPAKQSGELDINGMLRSVVDIGKSLNIPADESIMLLNNIKKAGDILNNQSKEDVWRALQGFKTGVTLTKLESAEKRAKAIEFKEAGGPEIQIELNTIASAVQEAGGDEDKLADKLESAFDINIPETFFGRDPKETKLETAQRIARSIVKKFRTGKKRIKIGATTLDDLTRQILAILEPSAVLNVQGGPGVPGVTEGAPPVQLPSSLTATLLGRE